MNKVVHFEIPVDDMNRAKEFYKNVFDWGIEDWPIGDGTTYVGIRTVEVDEDRMPKESGAINGGMIERSKSAPSPILTIEVDSIDEHMKKIQEAGGTVLTEKGEVPNMGYYSYAKDSEGNPIGLWETIRK